MKKLGGGFFSADYNALIVNSNVHQQWLASIQEMTTNVQQLKDVMAPEDDSCFDLIKDEEMAFVEPERPPTQSSIVSEWGMYTKIPAEIGTDVLNFWKDNQKKFPLLSETAWKWLCVPASSAPSERVFSSGGNIVSYKRTKLQPEQVEKLLYIQQNYDRVKIKTYKLTSTAEAIAEEDTPRTSASSSLAEGIVPLVDFGDNSEDNDPFATPATATPTTATPATATPGPATSTPTA